MGRGKVELRRIENKINRQVTFAKRRNGLMKKAYELSVLCDAEVTLVIFSNLSKLYEFCSTSTSMAKTIEKYQRCTYEAMDTSQSVENNYQDYLRIKSHVEVLQDSQRHILGEGLGDLGAKELHQFEHQLDSSLKLIRSTKTQFILHQISELQKKEETLMETNNELRRKLEETTIAIRLRRFDDDDQNASYRRQQPSSFAHQGGDPQSNATFQKRYKDPVEEADQSIPATTEQTGNVYIPEWML